MIAKPLDFVTLNVKINTTIKAELSTIEFGENRVTGALNRFPDAEPEGLIGHVYEAVNRFAGNEEQFDDITMLCPEYLGSSQS